MKWRTTQKCAKCPFSGEGAGLALWQSLRPERRAEILNGLMNDGSFPCHETGEESDDPDYEEDGYLNLSTGMLLCSGSLEWQEKNQGHVGQLARIGERLDATSKDFGNDG